MLFAGSKRQRIVVGAPRRADGQLIVADEDGSKLGHIRDTSIKATTGLKLRDILEDMRADNYKCKELSKLVIHAGANDIMEDASESQILRLVRRICI